MSRKRRRVVVACDRVTAPPQPEQEAIELARPWPHRWLAAVGILIAGALAYANSFAGVFMFDDRFHINDRLGEGITSWQQCIDSARAVVRCTLVADYARGGLDPAPYHLTNLVIHLAAGLMLYAVLSAGLALSRAVPHRGRATQIAALTALWWTVHPLQTESVTYLIQRAESLMGLLYLVTVYASLRRFEGGRGWSVLAVVACFLGMCTKPVMVTAPVMVLLVDLRWGARGLARVLRARPLLYLGLFGTWLWMLRLLGYGHEIVASTGNAGLATAGITPWQYFATQGAVIARYLRLAIVPYPLCLDYGWPALHGIPAVISSTLYLAAGLGALVSLVRGSGVGFLATAFFLMLAPSSSILPIADLAAEHRMYLSLAPVLLLAVLAIVNLAARRKAARANPFTVIGLGLGLALAFGTYQRNFDYQSELRMYSQEVAVRPNNARARYNLGNELDKAHRPAEAIAQYRRAAALNPKAIDVQNNLGLAYLSINSLMLARETFERAVELAPNNVIPRNGLAQALFRLGLLDDARAQLEKAITIDPKGAMAHANLGLLNLAMGRNQEAVNELEIATHLVPGEVAYERQLSTALAASAGTLR